MDRKRLYDQLVIDEGRRLDVYLDTKNLPTVGIGHKVLPEDNLEVGDTITPEQCQRFFDSDLDKAILGAKYSFPEFDSLPDEVQEIIINMIFNLGLGGFKKFLKLIAAINAHDWAAAADEMKNSQWYTQVGDRAKRLEARMRALT